MGANIIGILGGMGPYATLAFYEKLLDCTEARKDWDYVHTIIDSNPQIPSRTRAYLYNEESPVDCMVKSAANLIDMGANVLTLPCNSAHYFLPEIEKSLHCKFVNIIEETSKYIVKSGCKKIGVLAGEVTVDAGLYEKELLSKNIQVIQVTEQVQCDVRGVIEDVKQNNVSIATQKSFASLLEYLLYTKGCETVILGCTELGSVMGGVANNYNVVDSLECLANAAIKLAKSPVE